MSRYNPEYPPHALPAEDAGSFHPGFKNERHDETASPSGSDDGSHYTSYTDMQKNELDGEEDPTALTSQTLNADGTPKRPMNAFMIFARRRRPQVSAENQSMRTGEISKILSKEWTSMQPLDKQFYLDQAKQLKETFNTKYPDYVYRRRPNNSRKRRRPDGSIRGTDNPIPTDLRDEISGAGEPGESSPTDCEDPQVDGLADADFARPPHDLSHGYNEHTKLGSSHSRISSYPYTPSDIPYRPSELTSSVALGSTHLAAQGHMPYSYAPQHPTSPLYAQESDNRGSWDSRIDQGHSPSTWSNGANTRTLPPAPEQKMNTYSLPSAQRSWSHSTSPAPASSPSNPITTPFPFPTLNSPFYPNGLQSQANSGAPTASPTSPNGSQYNPAPGHLHSNHSTGRGEYDNHAYAASSMGSVNSYPASSARDAQLYPQRSGRGLPSMQSISSFSHSQTNRNHSAGSGQGTSQTGYWPRDKPEGL